MRGTGRFFDGQPSDMLTFMQRQSLPMATLVQLDFVSGSKYLTDWGHDLDSIDGQTWTSYRGFVGMTEVAGGDNQARGVDFFLGIPWSFLSADEKVGSLMEATADPSDYANRLATIKVVYLDLDNVDRFGRMQAKGVPVTWAILRMQRVRRALNRSGAILTLQTESIMAGTQRPLHGYLTSRDQKARHPGDTGLDWVPEVNYTDQTWRSLG